MLLRRQVARLTAQVGIKGPLTTPVGGGIRSLNVALRQELVRARKSRRRPRLKPTRAPA